MNLYVYPINHNFKIGDAVLDITAIANNWPDKSGTVIEVDGSHVKVEYPSGNKRWKAHINLLPASADIRPNT